MSRSLLWILGCMPVVLGLVWVCGFVYIIPGANDYIKKLPNGYSLMRQWSGSFLVFGDRENEGWHSATQQVGPSRYGILIAVKGHYVVGNLDTEEKAFQVPEVPDRYFIIDTESDTIAQELSFQEYEKRMHELGFKRLPKLIRPNKLTRFVPE